NRGAARRPHLDRVSSGRGHHVPFHAARRSLEWASHHRYSRDGAHHPMSDKSFVEVLLVEDNPADVRLTQEAFKEGRVRNKLNVVMDGEAALAYLRREGEYASAIRPDLILLDLNLPRKD